MKTPTATFYTVRQIGQNAPIGDTSGWTIFYDVNDKAAADLGDKFEAVRITVEPIESNAQRKPIDKERDFWRRVAAYLASCHAATAYGVLDKKSGSKYEKKRHISLLKVCIAMLSGHWPNDKLQSDDISAELKRCQDCYDHYKDKV